MSNANLLTTDADAAHIQCQCTSSHKTSHIAIHSSVERPPLGIGSMVSVSGRTDLVALGLFAVWCAATSAYATDAHRLLHNTAFKHLYVDLTLVQILVNIVLALPLARRPLSTVTQVNPLSLAISGSRSLGAILTNSSYGLLGATPTLVWKLTEPFLTIAFKVKVLKQAVPTMRVVGVVVVVAGVLTFSGFNAQKSLMFSPIVLANIVFPLRNVLKKLRQHKGAKYNAVDAFLRLQFHALPFAVLALLISGLLFL